MATRHDAVMRKSCSLLRSCFLRSLLLGLVEDKREVFRLSETHFRAVPLAVHYHIPRSHSAQPLAVLKRRIQEQSAPSQNRTQHSFMYTLHVKLFHFLPESQSPPTQVADVSGRVPSGA